MNKDTLPRMKVFSSYDSDELDELINNFIDELDKKKMDIKDIKYNCVEIVNDKFRYSALITYGLTDDEIERRKARAIHDSIFESLERERERELRSFERSR